MTLNEMKELKKALGLSNKEVSKRSGVSLGTVQKVFSGESEIPRNTTLKKLEKAFISDDAPGRSTFMEEWDSLSAQYKLEYEQRIRNMMVSEPVPAYYGEKTEPLIHIEVQKGTGPYTVEDYLKLPDDIRVELIDGHFYNMPSPTTIHQRISLLIGMKLQAFIDRNGGSCIPFIAPSDVQLDCDDKTMLQPDVFVVCDRDKITRERTVGAPDLAIEVLSPSGWRRDMVLKLRKYREAGVREYWAVLPDQKLVYVYVFDKGPDPELYTFEDRVPVAIWDGKCVIDFTEIYVDIKFIYEKQ